MSFDSMELMTLYEIVAFPFAGSVEDLLQQTVERCTRLFGARRIALATDNGSAHPVIAFWGFRSAEDARAAAENPPPNGLLVWLADAQHGYLYVEHALKPSSTDRRLYEVLARRLGASIERWQASRHARRSEFEKAVILDSIHEHVALFDTQLRVQWANRAAALHAGIGAGELTGRKCYEVMAGVSEPCQGCPALEALADGNAHEATVEFSDGATWHTRAYPVIGDDGIVEGVVSIATNVTQQRSAERVLRRSEELFKVVFDNVNDAVFVLDSQGKTINVNSKALEMFGLGMKEAMHVSLISDCLAPSNLPDTQNLPQSIREGDNQPLEWKARRPLDGSVFDAEVFATKLTCFAGEDTLLVTIRDVSERKSREEFLRDLFDQSPICMYIAVDGVLRMVNAQMERCTGYQRAELIGQKTLNFVIPEDRDHVRRCALEMIAGKRKNPYEFRLKDSRGTTRWAAESVAAIPFNGRRAVLGNVLDITERKESEQALRLLSLHDQLTGLYNRHFLEEELHRLKYGIHYPITVLSADVDGLKLINDSLGHKHGDDLLREVADVLRRNTRPSDILARIGGDEFAAILPQCDSCEAEAIIGRIRADVGVVNPLMMELPVSISIGSAVALSPTDDLVETLKSADSHMYRDKLSRSAGTRSQIVSALLTALGAKDFGAQGHVARVRSLCRSLGKALGLSSRELADLSLLAQVHDLGKVGIPDVVLQKEGRLTLDEWEVMRQHSEIGYRIASSSADLIAVASLILHHHEHWDGSGYPMKLSGYGVPIECRAHLLVDAYDAMTNDRPYRKARSHEYALEEIMKCAGRQFDPQLAEVLVRILTMPVADD